MNLRDLKYLSAVAKHKHFGKAAEACHVSQPTLSTQLRKLEEFLEVKLFDRDNKSVFITPIGKKILERAERAIFEADQIIDIAKMAKDPFSGELIVGVIPTIAPYLLPKITSQLKSLYPELKLLIKEDKTGNLIENLKNNTVDVMIQALPMNLENFKTDIFYREKFFLAVPKDHKWADRSEINQMELGEENILLLEEGHCLRGHILEQLCNLNSSSSQYDFRATSLETLRHMVIGGVGITIVPELAVNDNHNDVVYIPFAEPCPYRDIALVWKPNYSKEILIKDMAEKLKKIMQ